MTPHKNRPAWILIPWFAAVLLTACAARYDFTDKVDTDGDGKPDVVCYFKGEHLTMEERLNNDGKNKLNPRVLYFKNPVAVKIEGEEYVAQEMDLGKTYGRKATDIRGTSFIYTKDRSVVFSKSFFGNGKVDSIALADPSGTTGRIFENSDGDDNFDMFILYGGHQQSKMAEISLPTTTLITELRKFMPSPDAPGPQIKDPVTGKWFTRYDFRDQNKLVPVPADTSYMNEIVKPFVIPKDQPEKKENE